MLSPSGPYADLMARTALVTAVHSSVVINFVAILFFNYVYTATLLAAFHTQNVLK